MGNYSNELGQIHFVIDVTALSSIRDGLYSIFSNDCDFTENEEYFRKNTLKKGYGNEADRIVVEYTAKRNIRTERDVEKAVEHMAKAIFNNSNYYRDYTTSVLKIDKNLFSVSVSYIS
jgi:hypothetical protein